MAKDLYEIGEIPPVGEVPARMHAQLVRPDRYGEPQDAIRDEVIDVPELGPTDALVLVMAAGVNFNNVWAARGVPVDVTKTQARWGEPTDFHIVGSDAAGIVYAVGPDVSGRRGRRSRRRPRGTVGPGRPLGGRGQRPRLAPSFRVWGYDTCWGSMAQFTKVQAHQCLPKAEAPHVGGGGRPNAHRFDRLPDAARLAAEHRAAGRRGARVGRRRWPRLARDPARVARGRPRGRGGLLRGEGGVLHGARRGRLRQPHGVHALGRAAGVGLPRLEGVVRGREGVRQGDLGRGGRESQPEDRLRASGAGHDPHVELRLRPRRA